MINFIITSIPGLVIFFSSAIALIQILKQSYTSKNSAIYTSMYLMIATVAEVMFRIIQINDSEFNFDHSFIVIYSVSLISQFCGVLLTLLSTTYFFIFFVRKLCTNLKKQKIFLCLIYFILYLFIVYLIPLMMKDNIFFIKIAKNTVNVSYSGFTLLNYFNNFNNMPFSSFLLIYAMTLQIINIIIISSFLKSSKINILSKEEFKLYIIFEIREFFLFTVYLHTFNPKMSLNLDLIFSTTYYYMYAYLTYLFYKEVVVVNKKEMVSL